MNYDVFFKKEIYKRKRYLKRIYSDDNERVLEKGEKKRERERKR